MLLQPQVCGWWDGASFSTYTHKRRIELASKKSFWWWFFFFLKSLLLKILLKYALLENLFQELLQGYPYKHRLYRSSIFKEINWPDLERFKTELKKFFSPSK